MFALTPPKTVGLLLAVLALVLVFGLRSAPVSQGSAPRAYHVVEAGDSLWSIAEAHYDGDPRRDVHRLRTANDLDDATLQIGQVLVLPTP